MPFLILVILLCIIVALFAVQNAVAVSLNFVFWSFQASLVLVILGSFLFPSPYAIAAIATAPAMLLTYSQTYLGESLPYFSTIFSIALPTIAPSLAFAIL